MPIIDGKYFKVLKVNTGPTKYRDLTPSKGPTQYKSYMYDSTTDSMIELNKHKPDSMIELNKHKPDSMIELNKYKPDQMIELNKHKPDSMIELNKSQPDSMIELNKMREKYGVGEKAAEFAVNFQNAFFSALNKGQFFQNDNSESPQESKPFFVINVPSPPPATAEEKYVFIQEAAELSSINVASFNNAAQNTNRVYQPGNTNSSPAFNVENQSENQANMTYDPWKCCDESNLAHPPWYLGFWRETYIEIKGYKSYQMKDATIKATFGNLGNPRPEISHTDYYNGGLPPHPPPEITIRFNIADYTRSNSRPNIPSYQVPDPLFHSIGGRKEDGQINDPTGWLIVWNANIWKCQLARETINYYDYKPEK